MLSQKELSRIYWIAGSACAGKSTIATSLANELDWNIYHADAWTDDHRKRATPESHPTFCKISYVTGDNLWLRPLEEQIATETLFYDEEFDLVKEDLCQELQKDKRPIIFDGFVSPHILKPLLPSIIRAFYLIPTEQFQLEYYPQRSWIHEVLAKTSDKELAWQNWMQRDLAYARWLQNEVQKYEMPWLSVDGSKTIPETVKFLKDHYLAAIDTNTE
jgi:adenylate kinase family enzyme